MTWVPGPTLAEVTQSDAIEPSTAGEILAELHGSLHDLTSPPTAPYCTWISTLPTC